MKTNFLRRFFQKYWKALFILFFVSALAYLPNITNFTLYKDDWYYLVDGFFGGPKIFHDMFYIDRPLRGYLFDVIFRFFGTNPLSYQILAFVWRILSGMVYFWLLNLVWPRHEKTNLWIAMFFLLYPGYLWWVSAVEYQPFMLSQLLQGISFVTMILCFKSNGFFIKAFLFGCSAASGMIGLLLVDYTIGMELFRVVLIYLFVMHQYPIEKIISRTKKTIIHWLPFIIIPAGFMVWRTFFFQNVRAETDINLQLGQFLAAPFQVGGVWLLRLAKSAFNINLLGWIQPFSDNFFSIGLLDFVIAIGLAGVGIIAVSVLLRKKKPEPEEFESENDKVQWEKEFIVGGVIGVIGGIIPIVIMNREINITSYSHYLLNILFAAAPILVAVVRLVRSNKMQQGILFGILGLLILTNFSYSANIVKQEKAIADFWKQVTIRAPGFEKGTTFLVNLPNSYGLDNWDAVWAPINYLYADPNNINIAGGVVNYPFAGLKSEAESTQKIITDDEIEIGYRTHLFFPEFDQLIVISQPTLDSCVHVIDSKWPSLSISESDQVLLTSSKSDISNILSTRTYFNLDEKIFGKIDEHNWCNIYQRAELALQFEKWDQIALLRNEAETNGLTPKDQVEWLPFLQESIYSGNSDQISNIMSQISQPFVKSQACQLYKSMQAGGYFPNLDSGETIKVLICD